MGILFPLRIPFVNCIQGCSWVELAACPPSSGRHHPYPDPPRPRSNTHPPTCSPLPQSSTHMQQQGQRLSRHLQAEGRAQLPDPSSTILQRLTTQEVRKQPKGARAEQEGSAMVYHSWSLSSSGLLGSPFRLTWILKESHRIQHVKFKTYHPLPRPVSPL